MRQVVPVVSRFFLSYWLSDCTPISPARPKIRKEQKISLMLRQRQHTVSTSAYSTIIEILQLLQTVVTIGS